MSSSLRRSVNKYDNYIIAGDLNINVVDFKCDGNSHFSDLKDTHYLSNLVKPATCFKSSKDTLLDVLLTNKSRSNQKAFVCETGLIDCHKLIATISRSTFIKILPKVIKCRSYKNFDDNKFYHDLDQILIKEDLYKAKDPCNKLTNALYNTLEKKCLRKIQNTKRKSGSFHE